MHAWLRRSSTDILSRTWDGGWRYLSNVMPGPLPATTGSQGLAETMALFEANREVNVFQHLTEAIYWKGT